MKAATSSGLEPLEGQTTIFDYLNHNGEEEFANSSSAGLSSNEFWHVYSLMKQYQKAYIHPDSHRWQQIDEIMQDIICIYSREYPQEDPLEQRKAPINTRNAGRKKKYSHDFDEKILSLYESGKSVT